MDRIQRGTQIAYIPTHAKGNILHPNVELGFVVAVRGSIAFCRYWSKSSPGELRTKANSEATPLSKIVVHVSRPQSEIDELLGSIIA